MNRSFAVCLCSLLLVLAPVVFIAAQEEKIPGGAERGDATWYETDDPEFNAAHASLPFGTRIRITNLDNNMQIEATVTNRIPSSPGRILDISREAAQALDMLDGLFTPVSVDILDGAVLADTGDFSGSAEPEPVMETPPPAAPPSTPRTPLPGPSWTPSPPPPPRAAASANTGPAPAGARKANDGPASVTVTVNVDGWERTIEFTPETARPAPLIPAREPVSSPRPAPQQSGRGYRVQLASFASADRARVCYDRLKAAGFSPAIERHDRYNRVVIPGIKAADLNQLVRRLEQAGFADPWIRRE